MDAVNPQVIHDQDMARLEKLDSKFRADLSAYAAGLIKIKPKVGPPEYFCFNAAQTYVHERLRLQMEDIGRIRAIILKARQLGISSYIGCRFYQNTTMNLGRKTFILTHEDNATQNLFEMVKRFQDNMEQNWKPVATTDNANELDFAGIESGYRIGTAKNVSGLGRSQTLQNFHGSEVAFWARAEVHWTGVLQAIPDMNRTEIILESTANGIGGTFYEEWHKAEAGESEYIPIFLAWMWDALYRREGGVDFETTDQEIEYQEMHNLDDNQLSWMHYKNISLGGHPGELCWAFRQEYPATSQEAFQTSGADSFIRPELVIKARHFEAPEQNLAARVMGVDIARGGKDKTRMLDRQGRKMGGLVNATIDSDDLMHVAGTIARTIDAHNILMTFIDATGMGAGVYDRLKEMGYSGRVRGVHFGQKPINAVTYRNKRSEMWGGLKEWLEDSGGADIPDDNVLHSHIAGPSYKLDSNSRLLMEKKEDIKKRLGFSPDGGDAAALTFAETVVLPEVHQRGLDYKPRPETKDWMAL